MKNKFNIVDVAVIIFLCSVVLFLFFKFSHTTANKNESSSSKIVYTLKVEEIMKITSEALPDTGAIYDDEGNVLGNVVKCDIKNAEKIKLKSDGQYTKALIPDKYDALLTVEANVIVKNEGYFIEGKKNIGVGSEVTVVAQDVEFLAKVVELKNM